MLYRSGRADDGAVHVEYLADDGRTWSPRDKPLLKRCRCALYLRALSLTRRWLGPTVGSIFSLCGGCAERHCGRDSIVNIGIDCLASGDGLASLATIQGVPLPETVTPLTSERAVAVPLDTALMEPRRGSALAR